MPESNNEVAKRPDSIPFAFIPDMTGLVQDSDYIIGTTGSCKKCLNKYELVALVPNCETLSIEDVATFLAENWNLSLQECINQGIRHLTYKPDYHGVGYDYDAEPTTTEDPTKPGSPFADHPLKPEGHEAMQLLLDGYKAGQRTTTPGLKKKAAEMDSLNAELAEAEMDMPALRAMIAKAKAKALKKAGK